MANERIIPSAANATVVTTSIKVNGNPIEPVIKVFSITVSKEINRISVAKITIIDGSASEEDFTVSNAEVFVPGNEIEIFVGHQTEEERVFKGIIVSHSIHIRAEGNTLLKLDCRHEAFKMTLGVNNQYFTEISDADVFEEVLSPYNISSTIEGADIVHQQLVQYQASDWDFVLTRADVNGLIVITGEEEVVIKPPATTEEPVIDLTFGATILQLDATIDARDQYAAVKAFSWDEDEQNVVESEATEPEVPQSGNLNGPDLADTHGLDHYRLQQSTKLSDEERQAWADAKLLKSRLAKVKGKVQCKGFGGVLPGDIIGLKGVGDRFNGPVYVRGVLHEVKNGAWTTTCLLGMSVAWFQHQIGSSVPPNTPLIPHIQDLHIGTVTQIEGDPDGNGRLLVKVPIIDAEADGIWARLATLEAGEGRGFVFRPEIEDEVVVGFLNGDPRDPVILGSLHSSAKAAPIDSSDENNEKGYFSKSEIKMQFNDEKKSFEIQTPAGKKIVIDEDRNVISIADDMNNTISLNDSGITIESGSDLVLKANGNITIESNANTEIKASAQFKAEGSAGAEVSTSAVAILKGSLVQIN